MKTISVRTYIALLLLLFIQACGQESHQGRMLKSDSSTIAGTGITSKNDWIKPEGNTLQSRILPPEHFVRIDVKDHSFAEYLRKLPLKPHNSVVKLYNGDTKPNDDVYDAVVDLGIGNRDLHQCADAVIRLRAEYLWNEKQYDKIHFNFTNGFRVDYSEWMKGKRIAVKGNSTNWSQSIAASNTYKDFWKYLETVFTYAGTLSLSKELEDVAIDDLQIGDIFIQGGTPGHAIIVVDVATHMKSKEKIFLLAQSYMPAQEIQILKNPNDAELSPWYSIDFGEKLRTPEWTFNRMDIKRFKE